ncbi:MAG: hypothetical protein LBR07_09085 [Puniceicoccales bacterium]|jgi:hypothetical protein|nr:hypothetical protein [Puniceicoccales bacterium]
MSNEPNANDASLRLGYDWGTEAERDPLERLRAEIFFSLDLFERVSLEQFALPAASSSGQEHAVFIMTEGHFVRRVIKVTQDDTPGVVLKVSYDWDKVSQNYLQSLRVRKAFPSEYLQRIHRQNQTFNDDIEVLGVIVSEDSIQFVTSQTFRRGTHPSDADIVKMMTHDGFAHVPPELIQNRYLCNYSFYREADNLLVSDAKGSNFIKSEDGVVRPIDVICQRPDTAFRKVLLGN